MQIPSLISMEIVCTAFSLHILYIHAFFFLYMDILCLSCSALNSTACSAAKFFSKNEDRAVKTPNCVISGEAKDPKRSEHTFCFRISDRSLGHFVLPNDRIARFYSPIGVTFFGICRFCSDQRNRNVFMQLFHKDCPPRNRFCRCKV